MNNVMSISEQLWEIGTHEHALSTAALPDKGDGFASGHIEGEVLEDLQLWAGRVVEVHALQLNVALHTLRLLPLLLVIDLRLPA